MKWALVALRRSWKASASPRLAARRAERRGCSAGCAGSNFAFEKAEIAAGKFDAIGHLARDALGILTEFIQHFAFEGVGISDGMLHQIHIARDDGERTINVVNDAGVNLVAGAGQFLPDLLVMHLGLKLQQSLVVR